MRKMMLLCNMNVTNLGLFPCVMGIVNVTTDSFHAASRVTEEGALRARVRQILDEGGSMVDVGACSTRPGSPSVSQDIELQRLGWALPIVREEAEAWATAHGATERPLVSVDTFRAAVAEASVRQWGADIVNDISGGTIELAILDVVARTQAPYIMMHMRGTPLDMQQLTDYPRGVVAEVCDFFDRQIALLGEACRRAGTSLPPVVLDPGFGFAKTVDQNYELMAGMDRLRQRFEGWPVLVGVSRKSMIQRVLDVDAAHALNGTTVLNTYALLHGASILRVHDVREAVEAMKICGRLA